MFCKVFLLVDKNPENDVDKRLYYVGMTRAKYALNILRKGSDYSNKKDYAQYEVNKNLYKQDEKIFTHVMSLADIQLGFDIEKYSKNDSFFAGMNVSIEKKPNFNNLCMIYSNRVIGTFSASFQKILIEKLNGGYIFDDIVIENVVVWFSQENNKYHKHPLCKIVLRK